MAKFNAIARLPTRNHKRSQNLTNLTPPTKKSGYGPEVAVIVSLRLSVEGMHLSDVSDDISINVCLSICLSVTTKQRQSFFVFFRSVYLLALDHKP